MALHHELETILRATTAIQAAVYEITDCRDEMAFPAMEKCLDELIKAVKRAKKAWS